MLPKAVDLFATLIISLAVSGDYPALATSPAPLPR